MTKADMILEAALDLFIANGFTETPMDAIAEKAGVAKGTLYYHYKSKEGIVDALLERYARRLTSELEPILDDGTMGFRDKITALNVGTTKIIRETFSRLHKLRYIDIHQKTVRISIATLTPLLTKLVDRGAKEGICTNAHAREFIEIFVAASQFLFDPEYGTERMSERATAMSILTEKAFGFPQGMVDDSYMTHPESGK
jgi:AcrR family transcriptional regulator